ncbi:CU044_5270 family protein, partial [Actinomadura adrarensis]
VTAGAAVLQTTGGTDEVRDTDPIVYGITLSSAAEAAEVLDQAAKVAEDRSFTPPDPRQWVYTKMSHTTSAHAGGGVVSGPYETHTWELWQRVDGKQYAAYKGGKISVGRGNGTPSRAARYDPLPRDPEALLRKVSGGRPYHDLTFGTLITILKHRVHPPETEAAIFRALRLIPGVRLVEGKVDAAGRPAIALGMVGREGWLHEEVLLDPRTYAYLGERAITIADHTSGGDGEPKRLVKKGTLVRIEVRHSAGIVDQPGSRP